jgi:predicted metal-dependent hydrolase
MEVKIIRSPDRKKTIQAKMVGDTLVVHLPLGMHREEERKIIQRMKEKIEKKKLKKQINKDDYLIKRFDEFNSKYFQGKLKVNPRSIFMDQTQKLPSGFRIIISLIQGANIRIPSRKAANDKPATPDFNILSKELQDRLG